MMPRTPSQTIGPYLSIAMGWPPDGPFVVPPGTEGAIWIRGRLLDGEAMPVRDGVVETWQPDAEGRFPTTTDAPFRGFGRAMSDADGRWAIHTIKPGRNLEPGGARAAPHVAVAIFARGLLKPVWTRIYFGDEPDANAVDTVLQSIDSSRRTTLIAELAPDGYRFDVRLQGSTETVFFDV
jgi:protocatechuate 3,4-dioxygenase alpha subunit